MEKFIQERPQRLCLKCGKCCKKALSAKEYSALATLAEGGNTDAKDFLEIFVPFNSVEEARNDYPKLIEKVVDNYDKNGIAFEDVTFYKCKHLSSDNLCEIYENRPQFCKDFPATPWAELPEGCGYYGWSFCEKEKIMANVRRQKEMLVELNAHLKFAPDDEKGRIQEIIAKIEASIESFSKFGAKNW